MFTRTAAAPADRKRSGRENSQASTDGIRPDSRDTGPPRLAVLGGFNGAVCGDVPGSVCISVRVVLDFLKRGSPVTPDAGRTDALCRRRGEEQDRLFRRRVIDARLRLLRMSEECKVQDHSKWLDKFAHGIYLAEMHQAMFLTRQERHKVGLGWRA